MQPKSMVEDTVRGDTGVDRDVIGRSLDGLGEGKTVAWRRYSMLGGGDIAVTRRGDMFEVTGQTTLAAR